MKKSIPFPPLAFEGDLILISEDDADAPVVLAVLSPYQKRKRIPRDESTLLERADWSGKQGNLESGDVIYIDAVKWRDIWYIQYSEVRQ